jgi:hypothetical protein
MQLKKDLEQVKGEKEIILQKLKKMQKLAAKVPVLEEENVNLRTSIKTGSKDLRSFKSMQSEREALLA